MLPRFAFFLSFALVSFCFLCDFVAAPHLNVSRKSRIHLRARFVFFVCVVREHRWSTKNLQFVKTHGLREGKKNEKIKLFWIACSDEWKYIVRAQQQNRFWTEMRKSADLKLKDSSRNMLKILRDSPDVVFWLEWPLRWRWFFNHLLVKSITFRHIFGENSALS